MDRRLIVQNSHYKTKNKPTLDIKGDRSKSLHPPKVLESGNNKPKDPQTPNNPHTTNSVLIQGLFDETYKSSNKGGIGNYLSPFFTQDQTKPSSKGNTLSSRFEFEFNKSKNQVNSLENSTFFPDAESLPYENGKFNMSFKNPEEVGRGAFGQVWRCQHKLDGRTYAVKRIELQDFD